MDGSSAQLPESNPTADGASGFLAGLPSRGLFSSTVLSSNPGGMRVYICDHDTLPPEDQVIKTNQTNILIRSLMLKKMKGESSKDVKGLAVNEGSRKRAVERALDGRASAKRAMSNTQNSSRQEGGSKSHAPDKNFQSLTVARLRALLKEKGLSLTGKKDELIARLRGING